MVTNRLRLISQGILAFLLASCGPSYYNVDRADHKGWVDYTRENNTWAVSLDTVFRSGMPYALVTKSNWTFGDFIVEIHALNGDDRIQITEPGHKNFTQYLILGEYTSDTACTSGFPTFPFCVDPIVKSDLLSPVGLRYENVKAFCASHPWLGAIRPSVLPRALPGQIVERAKTRSVTFAEKGGIMQGGVMIGRFEYSMIANDKDKAHPISQYTIYYLNGDLCAIVTFGSGSQDLMVTIDTKNDGSRHECQKEPLDGGENTFLRFLVREGYL